MAHDEYIFTSESVTEGHPDKIADQISDAVLDAILAEDPRGRVACESLLTTGLIVVAGEITTTANVDITEVARQTVRDVGYTRAKFGFDYETCGVVVAVHKQSPDIAQGVDQGSDKLGAGDQGLMFGYACTETPELMPAPISLAHGLVRRLSEVRRAGKLPYLRPDGKSQVSVRYVDGKPVRVETVVVSAQHAPEVPHERLREEIIEHVVMPVLPPHMVDRRHLTLHINPTGRFVTGGPMGDTGVTGRKIIVDTYGGSCPHGGGAFSGKDPTKVDRSAAYMARHVAKNIVAAGLAERCRCRWPTPSASSTRCRSWSRRSAPASCPRPSWSSSSSVTSISLPRASSSTWTSVVRSTGRRPPSDTSAGASPSSPGSAPTARRTSAGTRGSREGPSR